MNEAERCDRLAMHAGKVLAIGTPDELRQSKNDAFVAYLEAADASMTAPQCRCALRAKERAEPIRHDGLSARGGASGLAYREMRELARDRAIAFASLARWILLVTFGHGIVRRREPVFAVLDQTRAPTAGN